MFNFFHSSPLNESVFRLVENDDTAKKVESQRMARQRYRSIHSAMVRKESADSKLWPSKTMGVPHVNVDCPSSFLKKNSKRPFSVRPASVPISFPRDQECQTEEIGDAETEKKVISAGINIGTKAVEKVQPKMCSRVCTTAKKPPIPRGTLKLIIQDDKDYIKSNAMKIMQIHSKERVPRYVDSSNGNTRDWLNSGLAPQYIHRKNYARVPKYILKRKDELIAQQKRVEEEAEKEPPPIQKLDAMERNKMIDGLKKTWNDIFTLYQSLPLLIDTPGKIKRKTYLELELKKVEKDLQTMQRHETIYVAEVSRSFYLSA